MGVQEGGWHPSQSHPERCGTSNIHFPVYELLKPVSGTSVSHMQPRDTSHETSSRVQLDQQAYPQCWSVAQPLASQQPPQLLPSGEQRREDESSLQHGLGLFSSNYMNDKHQSSRYYMQESSSSHSFFQHSYLERKNLHPATQKLFSPFLNRSYPPVEYSTPPYVPVPFSQLLGYNKVGASTKRQDWHSPTPSANEETSSKTQEFTSGRVLPAKGSNGVIKFASSSTYPNTSINDSTSVKNTTWLSQVNSHNLNNYSIRQNFTQHTSKSRKRLIPVGKNKLNDDSVRSIRTSNPRPGHTAPSSTFKILNDFTASSLGASKHSDNFGQASSTHTAMPPKYYKATVQNRCEKNPRIRHSSHIPKAPANQGGRLESASSSISKPSTGDSDRPSEGMDGELSLPAELVHQVQGLGISNKDRPIRWGTIIPLIGGSSLGCKLAAGTKPLYHLTFTDFGKNESHLRRYWPDIPYIDLNKNPDLPPEYKQDIDFITTVCPCAGLSMLNTSKGEKSRGSNAVQNVWMMRSAEYVLSNIQPKCFWGENAPGLFTKVGDDVLSMLRDIGAKYNYCLSAIKTNTQLHGIPQSRLRTFYFFWRSPTVPMLEWKVTSRKNLVEYLSEIPAHATHQGWYMTEGKASDRFKPYLFVLLKEGLTHKKFARKIGKGTITEYLFKNNLIEECLDWLRTNYPKEGFYNKGGGNCRTFIQYLEHAQKKVSMGLGYWDDSPRFVGMDSWPAMIRKSMITAVHPVEDRYINVREMMHLMGLPMDFQIDHVRNINHIAQNVPVCTAKDYADEVVKFCRGQANLTEYAFIKQDNIKQEVSCMETGPARKLSQGPEPVPQSTMRTPSKSKATVKESPRVKQPSSVRKEKVNPIRDRVSINKAFQQFNIPRNLLPKPHHPVPLPWGRVPATPGGQPPLHTRYGWHQDLSWPFYSDGGPPREEWVLPSGTGRANWKFDGQAGWNLHAANYNQQHNGIQKKKKVLKCEVNLKQSADSRLKFRHNVVVEAKVEQLEIPRIKDELDEENIVRVAVTQTQNNPEESQLRCFKCEEILSPRDCLRTVYSHYCSHFTDQILELNQSRSKCGWCGQTYSKPRRLAVHVGFYHRLVEKYIPQTAVLERETIRADLEFSGTIKKQNRRFDVKTEIINVELEDVKEGAGLNKDHTAEVQEEEVQEEKVQVEQIQEKVKLEGSDHETKADEVIQCFKCNEWIQCSILIVYAHYVQHLQSEILEGNSGATLCDVCHASFKTQFDLAQHIGIKHNIIESMVPDSAKFSSLTGVSKSGTGLKCFYCQQGLKPGKCNKYVKHFQKEILKGNLGKRSCDQCAFIHDRPSELACHLGVNHKLIDRFIPKDCPILTDNPGMQKQSRCKEMIECKCCQKRMEKKKQSVYQHYSQHFKAKLLKENSTPTACDQCKQEFLHPSDLARHLGFFHNQVEKFLPEEAIINKKKAGKKMKTYETNSYVENGMCNNKIGNAVYFTHKTDVSKGSCSDPVRDNQLVNTFNADHDMADSSAKDKQKIIQSNEMHQSLKIEMPYSVGSKSKDTKCMKCDKVLGSIRKEILGHYSIHFRSELLKANTSISKCNVCNKIFARQDKLVRHLGVVHNKIEPLMTQFTMSQQENLEEDVFGISENCTNGKIPHNVTQEVRSSSKCCFCAKKFVDLENKINIGRQDAYKHYVTHLTLQLSALIKIPNECPICSIKHPIKRTLLVHMGRVHNLVEKFIPEEARFPDNKSKDGKYQSFTVEEINSTSVPSQNCKYESDSETKIPEPIPKIISPPRFGDIVLEVVSPGRKKKRLKSSYWIVNKKRGRVNDNSAHLVNKIPCADVEKIKSFPVPSTGDLKTSLSPSKERIKSSLLTSVEETVSSAIRERVPLAHSSPISSRSTSPISFLEKVEEQWEANGCDVLNTSCELLVDLSDTSFNRSNSGPVIDEIEEEDVQEEQGVQEKDDVQEEKDVYVKDVQEDYDSQKDNNSKEEVYVQNKEIFEDTSEDRQNWQICAEKTRRKRAAPYSYCDDNFLDFLDGKEAKKKSFQISLKPFNGSTTSKHVKKLKRTKSNISHEVLVKGKPVQPRKTCKEKKTKLKVAQPHVEPDPRKKTLTKKLNCQKCSRMPDGPDADVVTCSLCKIGFLSCTPANSRLLWLCETCHADKSKQKRLCVCNIVYKCDMEYMQCRSCEVYFHPACLNRTSVTKKIMCGKCKNN